MPTSSNLPQPLRGITLDSIENLKDSVDLIKSSSQKLTVRLVMDPDKSLEAYSKAIDELRPHAYIMVQVLDSEEMANKSASDIRNRAAKAMTTFGDKVDLWEIGNELNGEWVGSSPKEINAKAQAAYEAIHSKGGRTALTLNYWSSSDCYSHSWEATVPYAKTIPDKLRNVDYVFLSVYETACEPRQHPSSEDLAATLNQLGKIFPEAQLGIGEIGAQDESDGQTEPAMDEKERLASYYYGMQSDLEAKVGNRYAGGYFWWYFRRDAVEPMQSSGGDSMWPTLESLTSNL